MTRAGFTLALLTALTVHAGQRTVKIDNTYRAMHGDQFQWTIFVSEEPSVLEQIKCVEYLLHPTFPNPRRRECNRQTRFAHETEGWGEFSIVVTINWADGGASRQKYDLDLHSARRLVQAAAPTQPAPPPREVAPRPELKLSAAQQYRSQIRASNDATFLGDNRWRWTVFLTGDRNAIAAIKCVEYALHPTFSPSKMESCSPGSDPSRAFPLQRIGWGTFNVGIQLQFKDGSTANLARYLKF